MRSPCWRRPLAIRASHMHWACLRPATGPAGGSEGEMDRVANASTLKMLVATRHSDVELDVRISAGGNGAPSKWQRVALPTSHIGVCQPRLGQVTRTASRSAVIRDCGRAQLPGPGGGRSGDGLAGRGDRRSGGGDAAQLPDGAAQRRQVHGPAGGPVHTAAAHPGPQVTLL